MLSLSLLITPLTALAATPASTTPSFQKFFGYYDARADIQEASKVSNAVILGYSGDDVGFIKKLVTAQSHGSKVIINVQSVFFPTGFIFSPSASTTFAHLIALIAPYQPSIVGYYVFDEPYWNLQQAGNPVTNAALETSLEQTADMIKVATPSIPSIIIFSKPEIDLPNFYTQLLPPDVSAIGFDCYRITCTTTDMLLSELAKMDSSKYTSQKLILVPDANIPQDRNVLDTLDALVAGRVAWYQRQALSGPYASDILGILAFAYDGNYDSTDPLASAAGWYGVDSLIQTKTALTQFYALFTGATIQTPTAVLERWQNAAGNRQRTTTGIAMTNGLSTQGPILGYVFTTAQSLPSTELEECLSTSTPGYLDYTIGINGNCATSGYTRLRTLGWIYQTLQPGTAPLYVCSSPVNKYHFGSLDPQCEGSGDTSPKLLGYILTNAANILSTASITADNATLSLGQSTTIRATFSPGEGDSLRDTDIDEVDPGSSTFVNKAFSGAQWSTTTRSSLSYQFTPTAAGVYKFYTFVQTNDYPSWSVVSPQVVSVTVTSPQLPPTASISQSLTTTTSERLTDTSTIQPFTLSWASANATSCGLYHQSPSGALYGIASSTSGSRAIYLPSVGVHHFWLTCTGQSGSAYSDLYHSVVYSATPPVNSSLTSNESGNTDQLSELAGLYAAVESLLNSLKSAGSN